MSNKIKISQLPLETNIKEDSLIPIVQDNDTKVITSKDMLKDINSVVSDFKETVNERLADMANKGTTVEVIERVTKEEINKQIANGTIANLTIGDNSITGEKIKDEAITKSKLDPNIKFGIRDLDTDVIVSTGSAEITLKNLFDKTKGEPGYFSTTSGKVINANGRPNENNNWTSDYIPCIPGETITKCDNSSNSVNAQDIGFFTKEKTYISGIILQKTGDWKTFVIPENTYYFRFDMLLEYRDTEQIYAKRIVNSNEDGSPLITLSDNIKVKGENVIGLNVGIEQLKDNIVVKEIVTGIDEVSLFDKTKGEHGYFNIANKQVYGGNSNKDWTSDYIPCIPGETLRKCDNSSNTVNDQNIAFFDKSKVYVSAIALSKANTNWKKIKVPYGAYFFRFDMLATYKDTEQIYGYRDDIEKQHCTLSDKIKIKGENIENLKVNIADLAEDICIKKQIGTVETGNLFDKNKGEYGYLELKENGIVKGQTSTKDWTSDYIPCIPGEIITKCDNSSNTVNTQDVCFYGKSKEYISGFLKGPQQDWKTFVVPEGAYFFRFDMLATYKDTEEIYAVRHQKTNLFDKTKGEIGWFNTKTGLVSANVKDWTSEYISCVPGETLQKCDDSSNTINDQNIAFFTKNKVYISGIELPKSNTNWKNITVPADAYFFRFDMLASKKDTEEIYGMRGAPIYGYTLNDDIKIKKSNIIGMEHDESLILGDTGDTYKIGVDSRGRVYSKFVNTEIPTVELDGNMEGISKDTKVTVAIKYRSKTKNFDGKCTLAWQGNGSVNYPKKNYKIKLTTNEGGKMKVGFRNWVPQDSYHLKANFTDSSHMRNIFMANLMHDVRKEDLPTGGRSTIDGFPVRVKINGVDQGIYTWNLKQSKELYGLTKENPNHLMYRCEQHHGAGSFADISNIQTAWEDKFPETEDTELATANREKLSKMINWVATADNATFKKDISKYLNLNYLIDYWIYSVCFMAGDNLGRNMNLITYDGEVWYPTLYDLDTCAGIQYNGSTLPYDFKIPSQAECKTSVLFQKLRDNFKGEIINRYLELRNTAFATESLLVKIKEYMNFIGTANYQLDRQLWPTINSSAISYNYIADNITKRLAMIDADLTILTDGR